MKARYFFIGCVALAMTMGCEKSDERRCQELDEIISARAAELPGRCEVDLDCRVVEIHPGLTVASTLPLDDRDLDALKERRVVLCGAFEDDLIVWDATCEAERCLAVESGTVEPPDAGSDVSVPDDAGGRCSNDAPCDASALCIEGECIGACVAACDQAASCDALAELGLGSSVANCIERCESVVRVSEERGIELARCLATSDCEDLSGCL